MKGELSYLCKWLYLYNWLMLYYVMAKKTKHMSLLCFLWATERFCKSNASNKQFSLCDIRNSFSSTGRFYNVEYRVIDDTIMRKDFSKSSDSLENVKAAHHNLDYKSVQQSNCYSGSSLDESMICTVTISTECII